ncbi:MAG: PepSY-associated TM helix domain-containing protein, partial [Bacteriovoracaceae bacterium]
MTKKTLYKIHKWAGITLGFFLFLLGVSGVSITFREELLPKSYPDLFYVTPQSEFLPTYVLYQTALDHKSPTQEITNLYSSHHEDEAYMLMVRDSSKSFPVIWTINPYTAEILGEISMIKNFYAIMLMVHTNFLAGKTGSYFVGLLGLVLAFFIVSGIIIFIPQKNIRRRFKTLSKLKLSSQNIHHQLGIIFSLPLLVSALTGMFIVFDVPYYAARAFNAPPR